LDGWRETYESKDDVKDVVPVYLLIESYSLEKLPFSQEISGANAPPAVRADVAIEAPNCWVFGA
jgi:hypothetical protein